LNLEQEKHYNLLHLMPHAHIFILEGCSAVSVSPTDGAYVPQQMTAAHLPLRLADGLVGAKVVRLLGSLLG
jgi:hypothetical protein